MEALSAATAQPLLSPRAPVKGFALYYETRSSSTGGPRWHTTLVTQKYEAVTLLAPRPLAAGTIALYLLRWPHTPAVALVTVLTDAHLAELERELAATVANTASFAAEEAAESSRRSALVHLSAVLNRHTRDSLSVNYFGPLWDNWQMSCSGPDGFGVCCRALAEADFETTRRLARLERALLLDRNGFRYSHICALTFDIVVEQYDGLDEPSLRTEWGTGKYARVVYVPPNPNRESLSDLVDKIGEL